ncbi:hypothetical protein BLNAU_20229 [Blattamonas nauphoetae]|uniref:RanBP2-type domain-containing protein n=1 Tax=Blattamonas nauphoetae TaxID=2049346 RepID=A0ABQ9X1M8_9EUKA|nr:hypothetical protein BLNAU_20229 [Blattamonas nauphoetae]
MTSTRQKSQGWGCPRCNEIVDNYKLVCISCSTQRPGSESNVFSTIIPGMTTGPVQGPPKQSTEEYICTKCQTPNFISRPKCRQCGFVRPNDGNRYPTASKPSPPSAFNYTPKS